MKAAFFSLCLLVFLPAQAKECVPYQTLFAKLAVEQLPVKAIIVQIDPFDNDTGQKGDEWLAQGIPHLLKHYLATSSGLGALTQPIDRAQYKIGGLFQHTQKWLRIFIQLKDKEAKIIAQFPVETPFPLHKQFFTGLKETAVQIAKKLEKELDPASLKKIENETGSVQAFQNYIKGRIALETYQHNQIEVALIWFQEARREDHQFAWAYQGLLEAYTFLILDARQKGESNPAYLEAVQNTLREMNKRTDAKIDPAEYPILKAHVHYVSGQMALIREKPATAAQEFHKALALVPIDAATAYALSQSYARLGDAKQAAQYQKLSEAIHPCIKK